MEFRNMRRCRQELSVDECEMVLDRCTSGVLALCGDGGYPYAVPMSYVCSAGKIFFHSACKGHKIDAVAQCSRASFCVVERDDVRPAEYTTYFRSVIVFGSITVVGDEHERMKALHLLGNRYNPGDDEAMEREIAKAAAHTTVLKLDIEHVTGKEAIELVRARNGDIG